MGYMFTIEICEDYEGCFTENVYVEGDILEDVIHKVKENYFKYYSNRHKIITIQYVAKMEVGIK